MVVDDGIDRIVGRLHVDDAIQVVVADPAVAGYSYIHELFGRFHVRGTAAGRLIEFGGDGVFEYVD